MNVVRLRYADTPAFLDVQSVVTSDSQTATWTGTASLEGPKPNRSGSLGFEGSQSWTSAPTISFQPITGDEFTKRLLAPMSPVTILMLIQAGWPIELVMPTLVRSVNGLHAAFRNAKADPEFTEMIQLLAELQEAQCLAFHVRTDKEGGGAVLRFQRTRNAAKREKAEQVRKLLGLNPGVSEVEIGFGEEPKDDRELAMVTRSMLEVLIQLGGGVDLPAEHQKTQLAMPRERTAGDPPLFQDAVRIHSGKEPPRDAYAIAQYKGNWFWIDDADLPSKRLFSFLMILLSISETGKPMAAPVLTISTGGR